MPKIAERPNGKETDMDEIGLDILLDNRELLTDISQLSRPVPFGWTFTDDYFNTDIEVMQIKTPVTKPGDIWQMGRHRLMCGIPTDDGAAAKLMDGVKARMIFTDPLWNTVYGIEQQSKSEQQQLFSDRMSPDDLHETLSVVLKVTASVCEPGAPTYIVMSAKDTCVFMSAAKETGYHWSSTIIWAQDGLSLRKKDYHAQYEPIWYGWLEGEKRLCPAKDRHQSDLWQFGWFTTDDYHPGVQPIALVSKAINNSSLNGDAILDLFGGSGITLIAAEQTGRVCYMMELEPWYADVIVKRFIKHQETDSGVFLLRNGRRFAYGEVPQIQ